MINEIDDLDENIGRFCLVVFPPIAFSSSVIPLTLQIKLRFVAFDLYYSDEWNDESRKGGRLTPRPGTSAL